MSHPIYKPVKSTVGAIILSEQNQILLALRNHEPFFDHWCLPGGHIDFGEDPLTAVKREILEETGLATESIQFLHYFNEFYPERNWHAVALLFLARCSGALKAQEEEVKELRWFSISEALAQKLAFGHRGVLEYYSAQQERGV